MERKYQWIIVKFQDGERWQSGDTPEGLSLSDVVSIFLEQEFHFRPIMSIHFGPEGSPDRAIS